MKTKKLLWIILAAVAAIVVAVIVLVVVFSNKKPDHTGDTIKNCTIKIESEGGLALKDIGIYIYTDSSKEELVSFNRTGKEGIAAVEVEVPKNSVAFLDNIPEGYVAEENYVISEKETEIKLSTKLLDKMTKIKEGSVMFDFTVTDTEGKEYTLSEILDKKDAVILNLWYTGCQPCKAEFPYLQAAYEQYKDKIEILAINPEAVDNDAAVAAFKEENKLTFPMAKCSEDWKSLFDNIAYPTTIVIDRYYSIAMVHTGSIDNVKTFKDIFAFFCSDDYKQTIVESIKDFKNDSTKERDGSMDLPFEINNEAEFDVKVEAAKTVYYEVYGAAGKVFSCTNDKVKVIYDETTFTANESGLITFFVSDENVSDPALIGFVNENEEAVECKVIFESAQGTNESPILLTLGDTIANIIAGNKNGLNYSYISAVNGKLELVVKKDSEKPDFEVSLSNESKNITKTLETDGTVNVNDGTVTLSVDVMPGDELKIKVVAKADEFGFYPATSAVFTANAVEKTDTQSSGNTLTPNTPTNSGSNVNVDSGSSSTVTPPANNEDMLVNPDSPVEQSTQVDENDNPLPMKFTAPVSAKTRVLYHLYKFSGIMTISDPDAYIIYNGVKYTAQNGAVYVPVKLTDPHSPEIVEIGNSGNTDKNFNVSFFHPAGSYENPYGLTLGDFNVNIEQGNDQGVYYKYTATSEGVLTLRLNGTTNGAKANITLYNLVSGAQESIDFDNGENSVTIYFYTGDVIRISVSTIPDENFKYPQTVANVTASVEGV